MGDVYRAHDEKLGRDVALKLVAASALSDPHARARLVEEARSASALNHPHICQIYEVNETGGVSYIAMELVEGRPLALTIPPSGLRSRICRRRRGREYAWHLARPPRESFSLTDRLQGQVPEKRVRLSLGRLGDRKPCQSQPCHQRGDDAQAGTLGAAGPLNRARLTP